MNRMEAVVCGIDPGLATTGYAILRLLGDRREVVDAGVCRFDKRLPLETRLVAIEEDLGEILSEHRPDVVAVEQLYSHYAHPRTAILMGHARGVILCCAAKRDIAVVSYAATRVKRFLTGNGRASKRQVQQAVQSALGLTQLPEPDDLADALAIGLCCAEEYQRRTPTELVS